MGQSQDLPTPCGFGSAATAARVDDSLDGTSALGQQALGRLGWAPLDSAGRIGEKLGGLFNLISDGVGFPKIGHLNMMSTGHRFIPPDDGIPVTARTVQAHINSVCVDF